MRQVGRLTAAVLAPLALVVSPSAAAAAPQTQDAMVAAANPLAVGAGLKVLRRGGDAIDAAVAIQAMLGLVEPQSSGVGGGAFIMIHDAASGRNLTHLGREAAPAAATPDMFIGPDGRPLPLAEAMLTGRATGVPGAIAALSQAHAAHGRLPWRSLFTDTIRTADQGFLVSPRLERHIDGAFPQAAAPDVRRYFSRADGTPLRAGDRLRNAAYARTLAGIAREGSAGLLTGPVAKAIVARSQEAPSPGSMTERDLAAYRAEALPALCRPYRVYVLCVPPPPSSGVGLLELMGLLERTDIARRGPDDPQAWFLFAEASRLMYADRDRYVADPKFVPVPVAGLLDVHYLDQRRALIGEAAGPAPAAGSPPGAAPTGVDGTNDAGGTSHFVVVDRRGNVVSMTTTIESFFGSGRMVEGFFLNNELTDFSLAPVVDGRAAANAVTGGKRPRSSMTPVLVLDGNGRFVGAIGSPGGSSIPAYVAKSLVAILDWGLPVQAAIDLPNIVAKDDRFDAEVDRLSPAIREGLAARGIRVTAASGEESGLHAIFVSGPHLVGGADSRREGVARRP